MKKILFVTAHSFDSKPVGSTEEIIALSMIKDRTTYKDDYEIDSLPNANEKVLLDKLKYSGLYIFHYSGHGVSDLDGSKGRPILYNGFIIKPERLRNIFKGLKGLKCVFFNSCNSIDILSQIGDVVDYSIGMKGDIPVEDAILFAKSFYEHLFNGYLIHQSYDKALNEVRFFNGEGFKPIFKLKSYFIMEKILFENKYENLDNLPNELRPLFEEVKHKFQSLNNEANPLLSRLIEGHSYYLLATWFVEKKASLAIHVAKATLINGSIEDIEDLSWDLDVYYEILDALIMNMDGKSLLNIKDLSNLPFTLKDKKDVYLNSFDILIAKIAEKFGHLPEHMDFFTDRVNFLKENMEKFTFFNPIN